MSPLCLGLFGQRNPDGLSLGNAAATTLRLSLTPACGPPLHAGADDTTGQGHISRNVNGEERTCLFIHLP